MSVSTGAGPPPSSFKLILMVQLATGIHLTCWTFNTQAAAQSALAWLTSKALGANAIIIPD